ncbi:MAG: response regulator [Thermodesulfobacteriota bacterium]
MSNGTILIVDDEQDIVEALRFSLEMEGFQCLASYDGVDGLKKAKEENPDLIILDIMLPKIDGYRISRLLKFDEKYRHIPIIMLTARTQERDISTGKETGADEYVTKPFEMDSLIGLVKHYVKPDETGA